MDDDEIRVTFDQATRGKMSPQAAVGPGNWPDEDGRQTKHRRGSRRGRGKDSTARTHRDGSRR
jgi:hypothetical protein